MKNSPSTSLKFALFSYLIIEIMKRKVIQKAPKPQRVFGGALKHYGQIALSYGRQGRAHPQPQMYGH